MDACARAAVTRIYDQRIPAGARVLDLMASWVSHLPEHRTDLQVSGLGLNASVLAANLRLGERVGSKR